MATDNEQQTTNNQQPTTNNQGFTLFEILIAIFIFAIIVTTIFGSYTKIFSTADAIYKGMNSYEMVKNCMNRMILDLKTIYVTPDGEYARPSGIGATPDPYRVIGDTSASGAGEFSRLRFTSFSHVAFERSMRDGIGEIVYYVQAVGDREEEYVLRRADSLYPYERFDGMAFEERFTDPTLCENIMSLEFRYYDEEGTEYNTWDSEAGEFKYATPRAIKIRLEFGDEDYSLLFETMVQLPVYREVSG